MTTDMDPYIQEQYRLLIDQMPLGVLSVDLQGNILNMNPALRFLLDLPSGTTVQGIDIRALPPLVQVEISSDMRRCL